MSTTLKERSKRYAVGAGIAGGLLGTMALLGAFQPNAGAAESGDSTETSEATTADAGSDEDSSAPHPGHLRGPALSDEQKACLEEQGLERPEGRPTEAQREEFRAAAEACGIELPTCAGAATTEATDPSDDAS